jgi:hypothetical protein
MRTRFGSAIWLRPTIAATDVAYFAAMAVSVSPGATTCTRLAGAGAGVAAPTVGTFSVCPANTRFGSVITFAFDSAPTDTPRRPAMRDSVSPGRTT